MYLCAKLVGIVTIVLSAGTISPLVIPYLRSSNDSWLFRKDPSTHEYDFQELDKATKKRLEELTHWLEKFSSAKTTTEGLKKLELERFHPLFEKIFATEAEVQALFDQISKSLTNLVEKTQELTTNSIRKLEQQKQKELQKTLHKKYSAIKNALKKWKKPLSEIICAIDREGKESGEGDQCKEWESEVSNFFDSVSTLFSSLMPQVEARGGHQTTSKMEILRKEPRKRKKT